MAPATPATNAADVPAQVFNQFLADLAAANLPAEVVTRLRETLVEDRAFTESALRKAVLGEESPL